MEIIYIIIITIIGLILGSFYSCLGYRIPNKISTIKPDSFCPKCKHPLKWYMKVPVFSYIILRGKCGFCKEKISFIYPFIELVTAFLFILAYINYGFSREFFIMVTLSSAFVITVVSDFLYYYISDRVVYGSFIIVLLINLIALDFKSFVLSLVSGIIMFLLMYIIKIFGDKIFKKESLGGGDIKLMGLIGSAVGVIGGMFSIMIGSIIALPFALFKVKRKKDAVVPYGPFLLTGAILILYFYNYFQSFLTFIGL